MRMRYQLGQAVTVHTGSGPQGYTIIGLGRDAQGSFVLELRAQDSRTHTAVVGGTRLRRG
jgi:hypothetical protein